MKKTKYNIHSDFLVLRYLHMPKDMRIMGLANKVARLAYKAVHVPKTIRYQKFDIGTRDGGTITLDFFTPKNVNGPLKCLIYFPGGGFLMPAAHVHKRNVMHMVETAQIACVIVHYRLAPKYAFPTALYDALDATEHLYKNAKSYGIDATRMGLGGDSAGGNLACAVSLYNQDHEQYPFQPLLLIYPGLDEGRASYSRQTYTDTPMFNADMFDFIGKSYYKNGLFGLEKYAFPLTHENPKGVGPVYLETAEYDCLHDDGILFYDKLKEMNVQVELNDTKGTVHGYDAIANSNIVKESIRLRIEFIKRYL